MELGILVGDFLYVSYKYLPNIKTKTGDTMTIFNMKLSNGYEAFEYNLSQDNIEKFSAILQTLVRGDKVKIAMSLENDYRGVTPQIIDVQKAGK